MQTLLLVLVSAAIVLFQSLVAAGEVDWSRAIYVSPTGNDTAAGTREQPLATVHRALEVLPDGPGTIALLAGTYREEAPGGGVSVNVVAKPGKEIPPLLIAAAPGQKVIFDGAEEVTEWKPWKDVPGVFVVPSKQELGVRPPELWEGTAKVRYTQVLDAAAVEAHPGSCAPLDKHSFLVHTRNGKTPRECNLLFSARRVGMILNAARVVVRGIEFHNYIGSRWSGAVLLSGNETAAIDCDIVHAVKGMQAGGENQRIEGCRFRDVQEGVYIGATNLTIRNCSFAPLPKSFALGEVEQEMVAIEQYAPSAGGTIEGCMTAGFICGFFLKTVESPLPILIKNNTFLDGIGCGGQKQPLCRYENNIIGLPAPNSANQLAVFATVGSTFVANYFFPLPGVTVSDADAKLIASWGNGTTLGRDPFLDVNKGDLRLRSDANLPRGANDQSIGASIAASDVIAYLASGALNPPQTQADVPTKPLEFKTPPLCVSSEKGVVVTTSFAVPVKGTMQYREKGATAWQEIAGVEDGFVIHNVGAGTTDFENGPWGYGLVFSQVFSLQSGSIKKSAEYEYQLVVTDQKSRTVTSPLGSFRIVGGPKQIYARPGVDPSKSDGSREKPFPDAQAAFNKALPGDTVHLLRGVYVNPAMLAHGGTPEDPIIVQGEGARETIFDGAKKWNVLFAINKTENIIVRDIGVRWFKVAGLAADDCSRITIERCRFQNYYFTEWPTGYGVSLGRTTQAMVTHCVFTRLLHSLVAVDSPQLTFMNNTAFSNLGGAWLVRSCMGSKLIGNSCAMAGMSSFQYHETDPKAFASLVSDYNNIGIIARETEDVKPEPELVFKPSDRYQGMGFASKGIICYSGSMSKERKFILRMSDWREFSGGKDANSVFADPEYADPLRGDFRVLPSSANILKSGVDGKPMVIGAEGAVDLTNALNK